MHCLGHRGLHAVPSRSAERSAHLCSAAAAAAPAAGAQGADVRTNSTTSTALQVRRKQHLLQDMLSDLSSQQTEPPRPRPAGPGHNTKKAKAAGFGRPNGSTATKQQQHRLQIRPQDACPCKSGLLYQVSMPQRLLGVFGLVIDLSSRCSLFAVITTSAHGYL